MKKRISKNFYLCILSVVLLFLVCVQPVPKKSSDSSSSASGGGSATPTLYVINEASNTVTNFNATTGDYIFGSGTNGTLVASSFTTGNFPNGVAVNPSANILYVTNETSNTVTYFNCTNGDYIFGGGSHGTLLASSFTTGAVPNGVAVNPTANILYVMNYGSNTVTYFNATNGDYVFGGGAHGTLLASSFTTGSNPFGAAVNQ
jgi:DNA-binding beta-propeller fold protein YncE